MGLEKTEGGPEKYGSPFSFYDLKLPIAPLKWDLRYAPTSCGECARYGGSITGPTVPGLKKHAPHRTP